MCSRTLTHTLEASSLMVTARTHTHCSQKTDTNSQRFNKGNPWCKSRRQSPFAVDERFATWEDASVLSPPQSWPATSHGTPLLSTCSSLGQSQSHGVFLQVFLPLRRAGGCKLPSSSFSSSTEGGEQPVSRVLALQHPGVCGAVEPGWGAASYLIFSSTLISLVILPVTNRES